MPYPDEIIGGSWTMYIAPLATARPVTPGTVPAAAYLTIGNQGSLNIPESGITVRKTLEQEDYYGLGVTSRLKSFNTRESVEVEFDMADLTLETLSRLLGGPATAAGNVTTTAPGVGAANDGYKDLPLIRNFVNLQYVLLLRRLDSPYDSALPAEMWFPRVQSAGNAEFVFVKSGPAVAHFFYKSVYDPSLGLGSARFAHLPHT